MTWCVSSVRMRLLLCVSSLLMQTHVATVCANTHQHTQKKLGHRFECRHMYVSARVRCVCVLCVRAGVCARLCACVCVGVRACIRVCVVCVVWVRACVCARVSVVHASYSWSLMIWRHVCGRRTRTSLGVGRPWRRENRGERVLLLLDLGRNLVVERDDVTHAQCLPLTLTWVEMT